VQISITSGQGVTDNLSLDFTAASPVPEPSAFTLSLLGLLSLGFIGWRRRRR
jgi:MYXO-CTERM domain-containing protein